MSRNMLSEMTEWIFPEVESTPSNVAEFSAYLPEEKKQSPAVDPIELEREELRKAHLIAQQELNRMQAEYQHKIALVTQMLEKLKNPLASIDNDVTEMMTILIKKISKKLILKEIQNEPDTLNKTINELKSFIDNNNGMIKVFLSANDQRRMEEFAEASGRTLIIDPALKDGDIVIKTQYAEVRALLEERIEEVLKEQYE